MLNESELKAVVSEVLAGLGYRVEGPIPPAETKADEPRVTGTNWQNPEAMKEMLTTTPARIGIGRAGARYDTEAWLKFRMDHAAARDAIFHEIGDEFVEKLGAVPVTTMTRDRHEYLLRPDLGRRLDEASVALLREKCVGSARVQIVVVDGLSGIAVERNAMDFIRAFSDGLKLNGIAGAGTMGTPIFVRKGRVAIMDHIGETLKPELIVELVGERPGLVTDESMSAYFCYGPNLKAIESDRTLISNIHRGGIPPVEAGAHAANLAAKILAAKVSGVKLGL
ncbi:MAG TPA: ethanolamine ammonia-lyase subunit EutC [Symbiobacteriaceae bacterium]